MTDQELLALAAAASPRPYVAELDDFGNGEHEAIISNAKTDLLFTAGTEIGYAAPLDGSWTPADEEAKNETWRRARETQPMRDARFLAAAANEVERLIKDNEVLRGDVAMLHAQLDRALERGFDIARENVEIYIDDPHGNPRPDTRWDGAERVLKEEMKK